MAPQHTEDLARRSVRTPCAGRRALALGTAQCRKAHPPPPILQRVPWRMYHPNGPPTVPQFPPKRTLPRRNVTLFYSPPAVVVSRLHAVGRAARRRSRGGGRPDPWRVLGRRPAQLVPAPVGHFRRLSRRGGSAGNAALGNTGGGQGGTPQPGGAQAGALRWRQANAAVQLARAGAMPAFLSPLGGRLPVLRSAGDARAQGMVRRVGAGGPKSLERHARGQRLRCAVA